MRGIRLALVTVMAGVLWISDREPGIRRLFGEQLPEGDVLDPAELATRVSLGQRPDALVIDGTQLLELAPRLRAELLGLPRVLVCTGMLLASLPANLVSGPNIAVLAKPFCLEDLEAAVAWVRDSAAPATPFRPPVQRRRARPLGGRRVPAR